MTRVTEGEVDRLMEESTVQVQKMGTKTCVVLLTLPSGFEILGSGACVDPANYTESVGRQIGLAQIKQKLWGYLGFQLGNPDTTAEAPAPS